MGTQRGGFKEVFDGAQERLRNIFGMELVELQTRAATQDTALGGGDAGKRKRGADGPSQSQPNGTQASQSQTQDGVGGAKKRGAAAATGAKAYILRSILDGGLIELSAQTDAAVYETEMTDVPDNVDEGEVGARSYGSVLAWNAGDHLAALGVMHVVLALILVNGKVVSDGKGIFSNIQPVLNTRPQVTCAPHSSACAYARAMSSTSLQLHRTVPWQ